MKLVGDMYNVVHV